MRIEPLTLVALALLPTVAVPSPPPGEHLPPEVGTLAPPLGSVEWWQQAKGGAKPLVEMRGSVVLVHSYAHFCDTWVRVGIPTVVELVGLREADGLLAVALTAADEENEFLSKARELGVDYSIGSVNWRGEDSPYLNLNETPGPTYVFVIGRTGGVLWRGDHGTKSDEFLAAVRSALAEPVGPALPALLSPELEDAVRAYVGRNYAKARAAAERVHGKHRKKKGAEAEAIAAEARALVDLVAGHLAALAEELDQAWSDADAKPIVSAHRTLAADFPRSREAKDAAKRLKAAKGQAELHTAIQAWTEWLDLRDRRPALFPTRKEKASKRFASRLRSYLKQRPGGPGAGTATAWLEAWTAR